MVRLAPCFQLNQLVWLSTKNIILREPSLKLRPKFIDLFRILSPVNPVAYKLCVPEHLCIPNMFYVSLLKPFIMNRFSVPSRCLDPVSVATRNMKLVRSWICCITEGEGSTWWIGRAILLLREHGCQSMMSMLPG